MLTQDAKQVATVPQTAKQATEAHGRWKWVERTVWTDRMLDTLERGVKGGTWFTLIDKVYSKAALMAAYQKVAANKGSAGVDHVTIKQFHNRLEEQIELLHTELREGTYRPRAIRRVMIPKPGKKENRPLGIPTVRDRIVQAALRAVIEPIFEKDFLPNSYGFRPERGCKDALRQVAYLLKNGYHYVVDIDIRKYFDTIPHDKLMARVEEKISDSRVLKLIRQFLQQPAIEQSMEIEPEAGTPQGAVLSPLLANIYLSGLDAEMSGRRTEMVRYADDMVILCKSMEMAEYALAIASRWIEAAKLTMHPEKTRLVDVSNGESFTFLGYWFGKDPYRQNRISHNYSGESGKRLRSKIRPYVRRANARSMVDIVEHINPILRGWFEYFKHSCEWLLKNVDIWVRMRLRNILKKRSKRKGWARGQDYQRWPNAYFKELGLFSMQEAFRSLVQSSAR